MPDTPPAWRPSRRKRTPWPRCDFVLRDGTACSNSAASRDGGPCESHARKADSTPTTEVPTVTTKSIDEQAEPDEPRRDVPRRSPRSRLAGDVSREYERLRDAVLGALDADKPQPVSCPSCKHRFQASVPDHGARLRAVQLALEQGYGSATKAEQQPIELDAGLTDERLAALGRQLPPERFRIVYDAHLEDWLSIGHWLTNTEEPAP